MPRMPGAIWQGEQSPKIPMDRYDIFCIHTIVGYAPAHDAHFSTTADGDIIQSRDTLYRSAANLEGNHRVIASENEDHGPRFGGVPKLPDWVPLTPEQVKANADILRWTNEEHGIPLQLCPNSRPISRGLAYHRQGVDGNFNPPVYKYPGRVAGGEVWTEHFGKVCPTDARIAQLPDILALALGEEHDVVTDEDIEKIAKAVKNILLKGQLDAPNGRFLGASISNIQNHTVRIEKAVEALASGMDETVQTAVKDALADSVIDVEVTVKDQTP